ncbi:MAG: hypothetical protein A3F73_00780 [Gallionellales bacterium RIFCSPLOWO2_12_FULL_59_22]|nr:MAG: hypothetical protein A3H99_05815 [Gallionellales bacterium RIFCSPLOWO2_02_FULL_59_110]OGT04582.1 MAG: hypothetical protein A2Z65_04640 [Gallionellales bacterium RIFCSPLOWO2_02_58_13]OGT11209.1 MAG: hypothetical protein A3F73_00780 [Gallionellales bacterium RIFCSPLOWO2_12_FULL_59_22]
MSNSRMMLIAVLSMLLLSACGTTGKGGGFFQPSLAEQKLSSGIKNYEDGDYNNALDALHSALEMGLSKKSDQVLAYKYSAFVHCISGRDRQCRDAFRKALEIEPAFELQPAEAGHPMWGPVFRSVKGKFAK